VSAPVVTVVSEQPDETESPATIAPVIMPDNPAVLEMAAELGELRARVASAEAAAMEAQVTAEVATADAAVASDLAEGAAAIAEVAVLAAAEPEIDEPAPAPEPDKPPQKQHWMFRERDEWKR
jgi:hypothetical protein